MPKKKKNETFHGTLTLSIRLLRKKWNITNSLRKESQLERVEANEGQIYIAQTPESAPKWLNIINEFSAAGDIQLENKSCSAIIFIEVQPDDRRQTSRTFALTFGTGHHALEHDAFVRGFGLKVALNSISRSALKNIDTATLDSTTIQRRIQASRKSDLSGFGIDFQSDLLRLAGGVPTDSNFAKAITGRDALTLTTKISSNEIKVKCKEALKLFNANDYKKDFSFVDHIIPVYDKATTNALDRKLFSELKALLNGTPSDLHIATPEVIDPEETRSFAYFGLGFNSGTKNTYEEIAIEDYIHELSSGRPNDVPDIASLKASHEIMIVTNGHGDKTKRQRIYDCFVFEATYNSKSYVIFSGSWYCIEKNFFELVNNEFNSLIHKPFRRSTRAKNEQEFIEELNTDQNLLNLDKVKASPSGAKGSNLEPCDFLSRKKEFIHLKDGHSSAPISHLWNQGLVSAESFLRDEVFRKAFRDSAIERQKSFKKAGFEKTLPDGRSKPNASEYKVIFGVMRHRYTKSNKLGLPFFSKVSLRAVASRIQLMGYTVEVHLIEKK